MASNCISRHGILYVLSIKKKLPVSLKNALWETVKVMNCIKSWPLRTYLFSMPCGDMDARVPYGVQWLSWGKAFMIGLWTELATSKQLLDDATQPPPGSARRSSRGPASGILGLEHWVLLLHTESLPAAGTMVFYFSSSSVIVLEYSVKQKSMLSQCSSAVTSPVTSSICWLQRKGAPELSALQPPVLVTAFSILQAFNLV